VPDITPTMEASNAATARSERGVRIFGLLIADEA
jgi:hypothetical protein